MRFLFTHEVPVPRAPAGCSPERAWWYSFDCAFVANVDEREYLGFLAIGLSRRSLADLSRLELFDYRHLHESPAPGCHNPSRRLHQECEREQRSIWSSGPLVAQHDIRVAILKPQTRALCPAVPGEMVEIIPPFRLSLSVPVTIRAYGLFLDRNPLRPGLQESNSATWAIWGATLTVFLQDMFGV